MVGNFHGNSEAAGFDSQQNLQVVQTQVFDFALQYTQSCRFQITSIISEHVFQIALFYKKRYFSSSHVLQMALDCVSAAASLVLEK